MSSKLTGATQAGQYLLAQNETSTALQTSKKERLAYHELVAAAM